MRFFSIFILVFILISGPLALWPPSAYAGSFEVAPTTIDLPSTAKAGVFYITNRGAEPIIAQIEAFQWSQKDGNDHLDPSEELIISPPMVSLAPDERQTIRLMLQPDATHNNERTFRLVVSEVPNPAQREQQTGVQVLLQFNVPVFVATTPNAAPALVWSAAADGKELVLTANNTGQAHAKISSLSLETASGEHPNMPGDLHYILAGASAVWHLPVTSATGQNIHIKARDEKNGTAIDQWLPVR